MTSKSSWLWQAQTCRCLSPAVKQDKPAVIGPWYQLLPVPQSDRKKMSSIFSSRSSVFLVHGEENKTALPSIVSCGGSLPGKEEWKVGEQGPSPHCSDLI
jgi:hypothetical protein